MYVWKDILISQRSSRLVKTRFLFTALAKVFRHIDISRDQYLRIRRNFRLKPLEPVGVSGWMRCQRDADTLPS